MKLRSALFTLLLATQVAVAAKPVEFIHATKGDIHSADPGALYEVTTDRFLSNVYEAFVMRDNDLKLIPALAESWENRDPLYWVFHLRRNAKFHNGDRLSADDVVFSFQRLTSDDSDLKGALTSVKSVEKLDEFTVGVTTKTPNPTLLEELFAMKIMSKAWCEKNKCARIVKLGKAEKSYADLNACGTGPYMLVERKPDIKTTLKRNPEWWGKFEGNIEQVSYRPISADSSRVAGLLSGEFDFIDPVPLQDIERIQKNDKLEIMTKPGLNTMYLVLNMGATQLLDSDVKGRNPLSDLRVRQAIYHALDMDTLCSKVLHNCGRPAGLLIAPGTRGYEASLDKRLPYDVEKAKALLAEAGYPKGFKLVLDAPNDRYIKDEQVAQAIVGMLAKVGIQARLNAQTKSKYFAKTLGDKSDFYMMGWMPGTYDVHDTYSNLAMTKGEGGKGTYNHGRYSNPAMDNLLDQIHSEMDAVKRQGFVNEMLALHNKDLPHIPLYQESLVFGKKKTIKMGQRSDAYIMHHLTTKVVD